MSDSAQRPLKPEAGGAGGKPRGWALVLEQLRDLGTELVLFCLSLIAGWTVALVLAWAGLLREGDALSAVVAGPLVIGTAGFTYFGLERKIVSEGDPPRITTLGGRRPAGIGAGLVIAVAAMVLATTGSIVIGLVQKLLFSLEVEEQRTIVELVEEGGPLELTLLSVSAVILAPITEELLFRHMLFRRLHERVGSIAAWTIPALAFGVSHQNFEGLAIYAWLATVFGLAYALSGRLWVAILVHTGHNAFALSMLLLAPEALP